MTGRSSLLGIPFLNHHFFVFSDFQVRAFFKKKKKQQLDFGNLLGLLTKSVRVS